jgi:hypothetical protein
VKRRSPGLFSAYWTDPTNGRRLGRATRREISEAYRLRSKHADLLVTTRGDRPA